LLFSRAPHDVAAAAALSDNRFDMAYAMSDTIGYSPASSVIERSHTMKSRSTLTTQRLLLRAFGEGDVPAVGRLADDIEIYRNTLKIPHPYTEADARLWLSIQREQSRAGTGAVFAITGKDDGLLMGACGMELVADYRRGELGYWLGRDYWGKGYATEAAAAVVAWGFETLALNRISAARFGDNPASGRVLEKIGMTQEGVLRRHAFRDGVFKDMVMYGLLREEWEGKGQRELGI
jgi:RimJ/RimL family protein N-acetyltransferase